MQIPWNIIDYEFSLHYDSRIIYDWPIWHNWRDSYDEFLIEEDNWNILFYDSKYRIFRFIKTNSWYEYNEWAKANLVKNGENFVVKYDNWINHEFNKDLILSKISDNNGNEINIIYDDKYLITKVIDTLWREVNYIYNSDDKLIEVRDFNDNKVLFTYYEDQDEKWNKNDLKDVSILNLWISKKISFEYTKTWDDNEKHNITKLYDSLNQEYVENTFESDKVKTQKYGHYELNYEYILDSENRVIQTKAIDREWNITKYDFSDWVKTKIEVFWKTWISQETTSYEYDEKWFITKEIYPKWNWYAYKYDDKANIVEVRIKKDILASDSQDDIITKYTYNKNSQILSEQRENVKIDYTYDNNWNLIEIKKWVSGKEMIFKYTFDKWNITKIINPRWNKTDFEYTNWLLTKIIKKWISWNDLITSFLYDKYWNIIEKTDSNGNTIKLNYNEFNNLIKQITS